MKRIITICLTVLLFAAGAFPVISSAEQMSPELAAESAVLINAQTGQVLFDKVKDYQEFPASTTKVMTALLTLENKSLSDVTTISHDASYTEGSRIYLLEGEQVTIEQLLYAMMLESANDAAIALAEAVGGSIEEFAAMMNQRAKELGAVNTHFVTPNGLPDDTHLTTAYDLALITREAMKNEAFRTIVSTYSYTMGPTNMQAETRYFHNTNRLLSDTRSVDVNGVSRPYKYDGILGVKTGYTTVAQSCLVAAAERDGMELIGVILKSDPDNQYPDMIKLLDYGFNTYKPLKVIEAGSTLETVRVRGGEAREVSVTVGEDIYASAEVRSDGTAASDGYSYVVTVHELTAPVKQGDVAGSVTVYDGSKEAGTYDVIAAADVEERKGLFADFEMTPGFALKLALMGVLGFLAVYTVFVIRVRKKAARERERRRAVRQARRQKYEADAAKMDLRRSENLLSEYDAQSSVDDLVRQMKNRPEDGEGSRNRDEKQQTEQQTE